MAPKIFGRVGLFFMWKGRQGHIRASDSSTKGNRLAKMQG